MKGERAKAVTGRGGWVAAALYTLLIFAFLPLFPDFWAALSRHLPEIAGVSRYGVIALLVILFYGLFLFHKRCGPGFYVLAFAVFLGYGFLILFVCEYPAEHFHVLEYGVLVILVYRALAPRMKTARIYCVIVLYTFSVGLIDELIQALLPNRVYDPRDIVINWAASLLAVCLLAAATWRRFGKAKEQGHTFI